MNSGEIIDNHYELKRQLGRGSYGEVWLAIDTYLQQEVALKFYVAMDDNGRSEFRDEYRKVFRLRHENLLTPSHYAEWNGQPYLELEYCPTSAAALAGKVCESELWQFIADVAAGLACMHGNNPTLVHQDIKPANILRKTDGHFAITDFGISVSLRSTMLRQSGREVSGSVGGSIPYMGPELFGAKPLPVMASDVWALGVTIYEMATGELPFMGQGGVMLKNGAELPILDDFSAELNQMMQSCLALNTWDRPTAETIVKQAVAYSSKVPPVKPQKPAAKPKAEYDNSATQKMPTTAIAEPKSHETPRTFETNRQKPRPQTLNDAYKNSEQPKPHNTPRTPNGNGEKQNKAGCILSIIIMLIVGGVGIAGYLKVEEYNSYVSSFNYNLEQATTKDVLELDKHYVGHVVTGPLVDAQWCIKQINILKSGFFGFLMNSPNDNFQRRYDARCAELRAVLVLSKTEITDDGRGGTFNISVGTDGPGCKATCDQNWCIVEEEDALDRYIRESQNEKRDLADAARRLGLPTKYYQFKLKIEANPTTDSRTATITFKTTYKTETISVTQKPKPKKSSNSNTNNSTNKPLTNKNIYLNGYGNIEMVYVEGGTFTMGATSEQITEEKPNEKPTHNVTLSSYYIGKYEVTQGLWKAVMGSNPSQLKKGNSYPVEYVSWNDCQEFIKKLNKKTGKTFRLPTEAEWEYAARGGKKSRLYKYSGGSNISDVAWYYGNSEKSPHPVGKKQPNELGIYDMSGNNFEWCQDWYGEYSSNSQINPQGPENGSKRVVRGGSWNDYATGNTSNRVSYRSCDDADYRLYLIGLRLVLTETNTAENISTETTNSTSSILPNGINPDVYNNIDMVFVAGGTFTMGATTEQGRDAFTDEKPTHLVTLSSYYIGKYEVTQGLWRAVMGGNPVNYRGDDYPVENVSWNDCQEFIRKLNQATGKKYRLPTEAEWEYAARGGNKSRGYKYSGSDDINSVAWYTKNSDNSRHTVGQKQANELGIYDMSGNVHEWCQDKFGKYSSGTQNNPHGAYSGSEYVTRGGSWFSSGTDCRISARRNKYAPDLRKYWNGFRLAMDK